MSLQNFHFKPDYNKASDNIAKEFYIPCMENSIVYDRISGYFGSTVYIIAWEGIKSFINNQGKMRIICSPYIIEDDKVAIDEGIRSKTEKELRESLENEINILLKDKYLSKPSRALACFVSMGVVEIKFAVCPSATDPEIQRLFHDKVGIFRDSPGNTVGFRGSMNETYKGLSSDGNLESIDVFPDWMDVRDKERVNSAVIYFDKLWNNDIKGITVVDFPEASKVLFTQYSSIDKWQELVDEVRADIDPNIYWSPEKKAGVRIPRLHQVNALEAWKNNHYHGIFEHATGSGKTYTALCAMRHLIEKGFTPVVLVPSIELLNQWDLEIKQTLLDIPNLYIYCCGDKFDLWRSDRNLSSWSSPNLRNSVIIIATMDTAACDDFLLNLNQGEHIFLVADEVHRLGSPFRRKILTIDSGARLGLSATPERFGDPEGTSLIFDYFGGLIPPPFTLRDAIDAGVLTRYFYYPHELRLGPEEQKLWDGYTKKIHALISRNFGPEVRLADLLNNESIKINLILRARIIKNAHAKIDAAKKIVTENYKSGQRWLLYCDNQDQLTEVLIALRVLGYDAHEYHSNMIGDRSSTLKYFSVNGGIIVSIKCLDEGVDIPEASHALILASSRNPREFIQRRGRILRQSPGKQFAYLYDTIVTPNSIDTGPMTQVSMLEGELTRAIQFGEWAENPACITELKNIAIKFGIDLDLAIIGGDEDDQ